MTLPETVQVGPMTYAVTCDADAVMRYEHENKASVYGAVQYMQQEILIDPQCGADLRPAVLLHEVMHACNHLTGNVELENEERIITSLAYTLLDVLRRNPDLVNYLMGGNDAAE